MMFAIHCDRWVAFAAVLCAIFSSIHHAEAQDQSTGATAEPAAIIDAANQSPSSDMPQTGLSGDLTTTDAQGQRVFEALFNELDSMVPGEFDAETKQSIEDAVTAFQLKNIDRVDTIFKELAAKNEGFPPPDLLMASLSYAVQDARSGLVLLERAAIDHPNYPGIYSALARLAISQGRTSDALALLEKCERIIETVEMDDVAREYFDRQLHDGMADVAMRQERFSDARGYLEKLRAATPNDPKVLMVSAELEFREDDIEKSQEFLELLKSKIPSTRAPESILASWYQRTGNEPEAEKWIRKAASKYEDDPQVQLEFASWAVNNENFPTASSAIAKAERRGGESEYSRNLKGKIAFCKQSYGAAEAHFQAIAQRKPNNFDVVNMYALSLVESDDPKKQRLAREIATRNFRALPDNIVAQAALGYIQLKLGETDQARTMLTQAARTPGTAPELDYFLASLLVKMGDEQQAKLVIEPALKNKGLFLYRSASERLLRELNKKAEDLPEPGE